MIDRNSDRRHFLRTTAIAGSALILKPLGVNAASSSRSDQQKEIEVTPIEDLIREHGVLRRILLVFGEAATWLRSNPNKVSPASLQKAAKLFRVFGEDYHEKKLEEQYIFPLIKQKGATGPAAAYPDILTTQHTRGREITDYILSATNTAKLSANASTMANALTAFVRMYENHAAREDTIVFPAWKGLITAKEYDELGDKFEDIEKEQFGEDGYENAVKQIGEIEASLGLSDISVFTAPAPPSTKK